MVARVAEQRPRREQHALGLEEVLRRSGRSATSAVQLGEADRARPAAGPTRGGRPGARRSRRAARGSPSTIAATAGEHLVAGPERDEGQDLGRRRGADRRVVLEPRRARRAAPASWVASQPIRSPAIANDFDMTPRLTPCGPTSAPAGERVDGVDARGTGRPRRRAASRRPRRRSPRPRGRSAASGSMPVGLCGALTTISFVRGVHLRAQPLRRRSPSRPRPAARGGSRRRRSRGRPRAGSGTPGQVTIAWSPGPSRTFAATKIASSAPRERRAPRPARSSSYSVAISAPQQRVAGRLGVAQAQAVPQRARSRRRRARAGRPSASPRRPRRTAGGARRTRSGRRTAPARSRRSAWRP